MVENGNKDLVENGNGNEVLDREWVGMGMIPREWEQQELFPHIAYFSEWMHEWMNTI